MPPHQLYRNVVTIIEVLTEFLETGPEGCSTQVMIVVGGLA